MTVKQREYKEEFDAIKSLDFYFKEMLGNFIKKDSPDFWNDIDNIGIEVTQSNYDGEQTKILQQLHGKNYTYEQAHQVLRSYDKYNKFKGTLGRITPDSNDFYTSPTKGMVNTYSYFDNILEVITHKTQKLQTYKFFETNFLYILDFGFMLEDFDINDYLLPGIGEIEHKYKKVFNGYFIKQRNVLTIIINNQFQKKLI